MKCNKHNLNTQTLLTQYVERKPENQKYLTEVYVTSHVSESMKSKSKSKHKCRVHVITGRSTLAREANVKNTYVSLVN